MLNETFFCDFQTPWAGQGTMAYEMLEIQNFRDLDAILVPISGGGMTSGIAIAAKNVNPDLKVIIVEPKGKDLEPCLKAKERLWADPPQFVDTIAEGIKMQQTGHLTFPILCELAEESVMSITDEEMTKAMRMVLERMKLGIEASAGAAVAAAVFRSEELKAKWPKIKKVGVILCGGNFELPSNYP